MRYEKYIATIVYYFVISSSAHAQLNNRYTFRHIDQSDGLLDNNVAYISQDIKGFIWIITPNGLQRYDGSRFVNYPYNPRSTDGIDYTSGFCTFSSDTQANKLWFADKRIKQLDLSKGKSEVYDASQLLINPQFGFESYSDSSGNTWYAGPFGVLRKDPISQAVVPYYLITPQFSSSLSRRIFFDKQNEQIWFGADNELFLFDRKTKKLYSHEYNPLHDPVLQQIKTFRNAIILMDSNKTMWLSSTSATFFKYNTITHQLKVYSLSSIKKSLQFKNASENRPDNKTAPLLIYAFFEDNQHTLWITTRNAGLLRYNKQQDSFSVIGEDTKKGNSIEYSYNVFTIFQDRDENIWVGTDKGISVFNPYRQFFYSVSHEENNPLSLPKSEINACVESESGDLLVGTWGGGITVFDKEWHFKKNIHFDKPAEYNLVWSLMQNDDGTTWAGCQHGYVHIYSAASGNIVTIHPPELNGSTVFTMAKNKNGNIFFGLYNGKIAVWNKEHKRFYGYNDGPDSSRYDFASVHTIFFDNKNRCWAGTAYGLRLFDADRNVFTEVYLPDPKSTVPYSVNWITGIESLNDSSLLLATMYDGLSVFNINKKAFSFLKIPDDQSPNSVWTLKKDGYGNVWFTTDYGLYKYSPLEKKVFRYHLDRSIMNSSFREQKFYVLKNDKWLINTKSEVISFSPQLLNYQNFHIKPVEITGFRLYDKSIYVDSLLSQSKPLQLNYRQNFFTIEYATLDFSELHRISYSYRLTGVDKEWVNANDRRFASYTSLQPGKYIFQIKSNNGTETSAITYFTVIISPPFWQTIWFKCLVALILLLLIYGIFYWRMKNARIQSTMKQKMAEAEMMALRAQMNPHFIFNCLNSIDNLIQNNEKEKATDYLARFARLIRSILENSKNNTIPCWKDLETLKLYIELEALRFGNKFTCDFTISPEILRGDYKVPPMIIQPFVENAIHHGLLNKKSADRKLEIKIFALNNYIHYTVQDNGIGRKKADEYKQINKSTNSSMGINIARGRLDLFNHDRSNSVIITDLYDENRQAAGTKVEINILNQS
jgi:ligand-binding sensor domain-containing protein